MTSLVVLQLGKMWILLQKNVQSVNILGHTSCKFKQDQQMSPWQPSTSVAMLNVDIGGEINPVHMLKMRFIVIYSMSMVKNLTLLGKYSPYHPYHVFFCYELISSYFQKNIYKCCIVVSYILDNKYVCLHKMLSQLL